MEDRRDPKASSAPGWMSVEDSESVSVAIASDGPCLAATIENLRSGVGGRPMDEATLVQARRQALGFLQELVNHYDRSVARGEVGAAGVGRASTSAPTAGKCPTGLLYGRVQSGKTLAMIALAAAAFDNGFKLIVVFTSNYLELVRQTRRRFEAIDGRKIFDSTRPEEWREERAHIARQLARSGAVIVCAKDPTHTRDMVSLLEEVGASEFPALIFDDEADQATPDTTVAARTKGAANAPRFSSAIFRRIVANDDVSELGDSVREKLRHNLFIQVTATPYALLLQSVDRPLRPRFTLLVEPGRGYTGGESFFSAQHVGEAKGRPPLVFVPTDEAAQLSSPLPDCPLGLTRAICFFVLSAAAQRVMRGASAAGQNFLCHTSAKKGDHDKLADVIRRFVDRLETELLSDSVHGAGKTALNWAYEELRVTAPDAPPLASLLEWLQSRLHLRTFYVVNSDRGDASFSSGINFIIGGNILGRGLTIENLLVTYYLRSAKVTQMDTMLQHARMFGYRQSLMPFTRVFLPELLAVRFHNIHESEEMLRAQFRDTTNPARPTIQVGSSLRPTRLNVLDGSSIGAFGPGQHLYPYIPMYVRSDVGQSARKIRDMLERLLGTSASEARFVDISSEDACALLKLVPVSEADQDRWDCKVLAELVVSLTEQNAGRALLYVRRFERGTKKMLTGAVSDKELRLARDKDRPTLFLFREEGVESHWDGVPFYYPSLVLPSSMRNQVFNIS
jgi:hypothetical protein